MDERGFYSDGELFYKFFKVMIQTSVEKAIYYDNGDSRKRENIDFRYIQSFFKLIVILLRISDFNKHEFMSKVLDAIFEVLENDHKTTR